MNRTLLTIALAASAVAAPAMADPTYNIGDLYGLNGTDAYIKAATVTGTNSLNSTFNFTLSHNSVVHIDLENLARYSGLTATLYGTPTPVVIGGLTGSGTSASWQSVTPLSAGSYSINVVGSYTGTRLATYSLQLSSDVAAPVPGPAGFLVAGAGALVAVARRRRAKKNETALAV